MNLSMDVEHCSLTKEVLCYSGGNSRFQLTILMLAISLTEQQLESILLFHCDNPLGAGHGQRVQYNLQTLERHILRQFIAGKPVILLEIPQVIYQEDIYTNLMFAKVRQKIPQVPLDMETKEKVIRNELPLRQLKTAVGVLVVVLGFLSSGSANPKDSISCYVRDVLKMKRLDENIQLPAECALEHTISLWKVLSVEMGKLLVRRKELKRPLDIERQEIHQELREEQRQQLDSVLGHFDLEHLLEILLEFIHTNVKHFHLEQLNKWTIVETIETFLNDQNLQVTPAADFCGEFPKSITLSQSVPTWTHIVQFQDKLREQK